VNGKRETELAADRGVVGPETRSESSVVLKGDTSGQDETNAPRITLQWPCPPLAPAGPAMASPAPVVIDRPDSDADLREEEKKHAPVFAGAGGQPLDSHGNQCDLDVRHRRGHGIVHGEPEITCRTGRSRRRKRCASRNS